MSNPVHALRYRSPAAPAAGGMAIGARGPGSSAHRPEGGGRDLWSIPLFRSSDRMILDVPNLGTPFNVISTKRTVRELNNLTRKRSLCRSKVVDGVHSRKIRTAIINRAGELTDSIKETVKLPVRSSDLGVAATEDKTIKMLKLTFVTRISKEQKMKDDDDCKGYRYNYAHVTKAELNKLSSEFHREFRHVFGDFSNDEAMKMSHKFFPFTADPRDRMQRMTQKFAETCDKQKIFCDNVRQNGVKSVRATSYWRRWTYFTRIEQFTDHYKTFPRLMEYSCEDLLKLAETRADGSLLPLVRTMPHLRQSKILKRLIDAKYLAEVATGSSLGIWRIDDEHGPLGLELTLLGQKRLKELVKNYHFSEHTTDDPSLAWRHNGEIMVSLKLSGDGRHYLAGRQSGASLKPDHNEGDGDDGEYLSAELEPIDEVLASNEYAVLLRYMVPILEKFAAEGKIPAEYPEAIRLLSWGDPPDNIDMAQGEIAARVGVSDTTISRWKDEFTQYLDRPDLREMLLEVVRAERLK
jgi:hypothetical protein